MGLNDLRRAYRAAPLAPSELHDDPIVQVARWIAEARDRFADPTEVNAMALATADQYGRPSVRTVLLTGIDECGVTFFTHRGSRKAREVQANPYAALCLHWQPIFRQVRISGRCSAAALSLMSGVRFAATMDGAVRRHCISTPA